MQGAHKRSALHRMFCELGEQVLAGMRSDPHKSHMPANPISFGAITIAPYARTTYWGHSLLGSAYWGQGQLIGVKLIGVRSSLLGSHLVL